MSKPWACPCCGHSCPPERGIKYLGYPVGEMIARGWLGDPRSREGLDPRDKPAVRAALLRFFGLPDTKNIRRAAREAIAGFRVACVLSTDESTP